MSDLYESIKPELEEIIRFNKLMKREVGNPDHLLLQAKLLNEEAAELLDAGDDWRPIVEAICYIIVVAQGLLYIQKSMPNYVEMGGFCSNDRAGIFRVCSDCYASAWDNPINYRSAIISKARIAIALCVNFCIDNGIDLKANLQAVNISNFSKFCQTKDEARDSLEWYDTHKSVQGIFRETDDDQYPYALYSKGSSNPKFPQGKLLKSIYYKEPELKL